MCDDPKCPCNDPRASEQFRMECEGRYVARHADPRGYLAMVQDSRGRKAMLELIEVAKKEKGRNGTDNNGDSDSD